MEIVQMSVFQVIAILFGFFMVYTVSIHQKKRTLSELEASFWTSIWVFFVVIAVFPNLLIEIAHFMRFTRVFDLLLVGAFMILTILTFTNYFAYKKTQDRLETVVRSLTLRESKLSRAKK